MKLTKIVARSFHRLQSEEFRPLVDYLTAQRDDATRALTLSTDIAAMRRLQGRISAYNDILTSIAAARDLLDKLGD